MHDGQGKVKNTEVLEGDAEGSRRQSPPLFNPVPGWHHPHSQSLWGHLDSSTHRGFPFGEMDLLTKTQAPQVLWLTHQRAPALLPHIRISAPCLWEGHLTSPTSVSSPRTFELSSPTSQASGRHQGDIVTAAASLAMLLLGLLSR